MPAVVFVTAYDQYALRAFEQHALDYLLKPFDQERFFRTLEHAKLRVAERKSTQHAAIAQLLASEQSRRANLNRITVKRNGRILLLPTHDIDWIEAEDNYVLLHCGKEAYIVASNLVQHPKQARSRYFHSHSSQRDRKYRSFEAASTRT